MEKKIYYKRNLPHFQPAKATYFITFRLTNSLPRTVVEELRKENEKEISIILNLKDEKLKEKKLYHQQKR